MIYVIHLDCGGGSSHTTVDGEFKSVTEVQAKLKSGGAIRCTRKPQWPESRLIDTARAFLDSERPGGVDQDTGIIGDAAGWDLQRALDGMSQGEVYELYTRTAKVAGIIALPGKDRR